MTQQQLASLPKEKKEGFYISPCNRYCFVTKEKMGYTVHFKGKDSSSLYFGKYAFETTKGYTPIDEHFKEINPSHETHVVIAGVTRGIFFNVLDAVMFMKSAAFQFEFEGGVAAKQRKIGQKCEFKMIVSTIGTIVHETHVISADGVFSKEYHPIGQDYIKENEDLIKDGKDTSDIKNAYVPQLYGDDYSLPWEDAQ